MNQTTRVAVIMAGGSGERFWPLSRQARPKQLLRLTSPDRTLLEESIDRISGLIPHERIFVATARALVDPIREALTSIPPENVLGEPCKRNTAGCLVWAAGQLLARFPDEPLSMAVLTADHRIGATDKFQRAVEAALAAAERHGALTTIGVVPDRPETGYGYIETAEGARPLAQTGDGPPVYPVAGFREKPDPATAEQYVAGGRHYWNSGMFFWRVDRFLDELHEATPAHAEITRRIAAAVAGDDPAAADAAFEELENISIDYALMEKAGNVAVVRADFPWDDVGAWDALERSLPADGEGNVTAGDPVLIETGGCIVYNEPGAGRMAVATVGVRDLIVVVSGDAVLVAPKDRAQDVKQAVAALRERGARQL